MGEVRCIICFERLYLAFIFVQDRFLMFPHKRDGRTDGRSENLLGRGRFQKQSRETTKGQNGLDQKTNDSLTLFDLLLNGSREHKQRLS